MVKKRDLFSMEQGLFNRNFFDFLVLPKVKLELLSSKISTPIINLPEVMVTASALNYQSTIETIDIVRK